MSQSIDEDSCGLGTTVALLFGSFILLMLVALQPPSSGQVAIFAAPWSSERELYDMVAAAGGRAVRAGALPFVIVATDPEPGFSDRLYASGAWLVTDPVALGGCFLNA